MKRSIGLFLFFLAGNAAFAQTGPGGVGNNTTNVLWLAGDFGVNATGTAVNSWTDRSGNANTAGSPTLAARPTLTTGALNGYPILQFDGVDDQMRIPDVGSLDLQQWSIFMVCAETLAKNNNQWLSKGTNAQPNYALYSTATGIVQMPIYNTLFFTTNPGSTVPTTGTAFNVVHYDNFPTGIFGTYLRQLFKNGSSVYLDVGGLNAAATNNNMLYIGNVQGVTTSFLSGSFAEAIIYRTVVNTAQRIIINNYLAAKYGTTLATNDIYVQDLPGNGHYDHDVAGIGRVDGSNIHADARGTGVVRINTASNLGNNEFLIWGHDNGALGAFGSTDFPVGLQGRWHRVWRVNEVSQAGAAVDVGNVNITFDLTGQGPVVASQLRLLVDANNNGIFADDIPISGAVAAGGNDYRFNAVSALVNGRRFTLGTIDMSSTPLPIELVEFTAECSTNGAVDLGWVTATERDNDRFTVQRSSTGSEWENVVHVRGAGNSSVPIVYRERDAGALSQLSYYRLMQTDLIGTSTWSHAVAVNCGRRDDGLLIFPDPAQDEVNVVFGPAMTRSSVQLYNELGQPFTVPMTRSEGRVLLSVASLPSGMYLVVVTGDQGVLKKRLIVSR